MRWSAHIQVYQACLRHRIGQSVQLALLGLLEMLGQDNSASLALAHSERSRSAAIGPVGLLVLIGSGIHKARTRVCFFLASGFQASGYSI